MAYNHWFVSRQKRQLTTILPALIAFSDVCVGEKWAGNTELQLKFEDELQNRSITEHGSLRARRSGAGGGGIRTLFKQMKDLGLVFTENDNGLCRLTLISEALIKGDVTFTDAMILQLQKYQYPSAACWSGSGSVEHSFKVHPFQFLLRLLRTDELNNILSADEIAYIVIHEAKDDEESTLNKVVKLIIKSRLDTSLIDKLKNKDEKKTWYNIANTLCNYLSLTQFLDRGFKTISIRSGKENEVDSFIQKDPKFISNPQLSENYIRAYGRGFAAKDLRDFNRTDKKTQKEIKESRIRKEYVLLALKTPITGITSDVVSSISKATGIDEKEIEKFLLKNYPKGNIDDFFLSYRELANMGISGARDFELATCEMFEKIFHMKAKHVGPIGNTPDVFVESDDYKYCGIIDNKAYKNGYSISGNHKRVMEDVYIPEYKKYGHTDYELAFFTYVAGSFKNNIDSQIQEINKDKNVNGSAMPVDVLINVAQDYAKKKWTHNSLKTVFSVNREVRLSDIENIENMNYQSVYDYGMVASTDGPKNAIVMR